MSMRRLINHQGGSVAPLFALMILPLMGAVGAGVEYSRAASVKSSLQSSIDSALLAGAKTGAENWTQVATDTFNANFNAITGRSAQVIFQSSGDGVYSATGTTVVPLAFGFFGLSEVTVTASSQARTKFNPEKSCILALDGGAARSHYGIDLGGAPNIQLAGCAIRSNTSMNCNGHSGGATASIAAGLASGCSNPESYATPVPDVYDALKENISQQCGSSRTGVTWVAGGAIPSRVVSISKSGYTEHHVCGDLNLSGTGELFPGGSSDNVVIVENGSVIVNQDAVVNAARTTIVLTGSNTFGSAIEFPNGNGQSATLKVSPSMDAANPWHGIAVYQDPSLTRSVDNNWGPGATFNADGVVYLPQSNLLMRGVAQSGNYQCTKFVSKTFQTNGSVQLNFAQDETGCVAIKMERWAPLHLAM